MNLLSLNQVSNITNETIKTFKKMLKEIAKTIISKAFEMASIKFSSNNSVSELVDENSELDLEKVKEIFELDFDISEVGYLDCCLGEQQDDRDFAEQILYNIESGKKIISLTVYFDSDTQYQEYYEYLLIEV